MDHDREMKLQRGEASLTHEEMLEGWHFCWEFDGLLTTGEKGDKECFCGVFQDGEWRTDCTIQ